MRNEEWVPAQKPLLGERKEQNDDGSEEIFDNVLEGGYKYKEIREIKAGGEGPKVIAEIDMGYGKGRYFLKFVHSRKEAGRQADNCEALRKRGIPVPKTFRGIVFKGGECAIVATDLTQNDKYLAVGMNNKEIWEENYKDMANAIPEVIAEAIASEMISICEKAADYKEDIAGDSGAIFSLRSNAYIFRIDPNDPSDAKVFVADIGADVDKTMDKTNKEAAENNLMQAADFYAWMTGRIMIIPSDSKFSSLNEEIRHSSEEIIEHREFRKSMDEDIPH